MKIPLYQIDAFANQVFKGNPAAVCPLEKWLDDEILQNIAAENNLSETAYFVARGNQYELRWFTPKTEVDLCGHATLASAFVIFEHVNPSLAAVDFSTRSGLLRVERDGPRLAMDFPSRPASNCAAPRNLLDALKVPPREVLLSRDYLLVYETEEIVRSLQPDMGQLEKVDCLGTIVTAPGRQVDFVSRFFAPRAGISEDPVTGSAHCTLVPYWSRRLAKKELHALQVSRRGGELFCTDNGERVKIAGHAVQVLFGHIELAA
jgi:predicted PhzF superfamily epimerase YddE/YHI9